MAARVLRHADPAAFWRAAQGFLEKDETANTQMLAIASRHALEPGDHPPGGFTVEDGSELRAAALLTTKGTLFLTATDRANLRALLDAVAASGQSITDISAERTTAEACAEAAGGGFRAHVGLRLYRLETVNEIPAVPGTMRQAADSDFRLLCEWQRTFLVEANVRESIDEVPQLVRRRLDTGGAWFWEVDGVPVVHAGFRHTPINSARIAPVYTPRELRGRGYATALVAALSRLLLAQGRFPLYLFADAENPTANGVYSRVGFRPVGEHLHLTRAAADS